jgi:hypothetical protein
MRRFYFNVGDVPDTNGAFLSNLADARCRAMTIARQAVCSKPDRFRDESNWELKVTDNSGTTMFQLQITTPSLPRALRS